MLLVLLLLQSTGQPDIQLDIRAHAKSVTIERKGEAKLVMQGDGPGTRVESRVEPKPDGKRQVRNVNVALHAEATIADPASKETPSPN